MVDCEASTMYSRTRNAVDIKPMFEPGCKFASNPKFGFGTRAVQCLALNKINIQDAIGKASDLFVVIPKPPTDKHLTKSIRDVLKHFAAHVFET